MDINDKLLARLIAAHKKPKDLTGQNGLLPQLPRPLFERGIALMTGHQGYAKKTGKHSNSSPEWELPEKNQRLLRHQASLRKNPLKMLGSKTWLILALAILATIVGCDSREMVVPLTREEIQARVAPRFPITKNWLVVNIVLREPEISLTEGAHHIGINMLAEVNIPFLKPMSGYLGATVVPRYDAESKSFYLDQATVERLDLPGLMPELEAEARVAIETIARQELAKHPIYELKGRNFKVIPAGFALREVQVRDGKLRATFSPPLQT